MTYAEKLKDPRWQRKRLEILSRDEFTCTLCGDKKNTLHVHHKKYNGNPWEAEEGDLTTHCEHCHQIIEVFKEFNLIVKGIVKLKNIVNDGNVLFGVVVSDNHLYILEAEAEVPIKSLFNLNESSARHFFESITNLLKNA